LNSKKTPVFDLPIIKGIGFGLLIAVLLGPVFFALIQTSITKGFGAGAGMAVGIVLSDAFCVAISFLGLMQVVQGPVALRWIGIIGGLFMLIYGIVLLLSRKVQREAVHLPDVNTGLVFGGSLAKGFLLNILNPFVIVYWLGVSSFVSSMPELDKTDKLWFFAGTLGTILATDLLKSWGAKKLRHYVTRQVILWLNRISGSVLLLFGVKILYDVLVLNKSFIMH
jgi:threonine/homoserine/homoserine lactone efflux protein